MKKMLVIKNITKLNVFCISMLLLIYFSKYVFGNANEIKIEKNVILNSTNINNITKSKIGSFHLRTLQKKLNINTGTIIASNEGNNPLRLYGILIDNNVSNNSDLINDSLNIFVNIDGIRVYNGKLKNKFGNDAACFKVIKKLQSNTSSKVSIIISSGNNSLNKTNKYNFELYLLSTTKDNLDFNFSESRNIKYLGGYYSQDYNKYINEFWAECVEKEDEIWFYYNKTSFNRGFEYIVLDIKNEDVKDIGDIRILCFKKSEMISVKGILEENVVIDWKNNVIKIKKKALAQYDSGFDVRIGSAKTINSTIEMTSYKHYAYEI